MHRNLIPTLRSTSISHNVGKSLNRRSLPLFEIPTTRDFHSSISLLHKKPPELQRSKVRQHEEEEKEKEFDEMRRSHRRKNSDPSVVPGVGDEEVPTVAVILHPIVYNKGRKEDVIWRMEEAVNLCETLDWHIIHKGIVPIRDVNRRTFFGKGKLEEIEHMMKSMQANTLYINTSLNTAQIGFLNERFGDRFEVKDRFGLVLDIFTQRANTREAKLQIELAHLQFRKSTLIHIYDSDTSDILEQQRGGTQSLGGYGETKLEKKRRTIQDRIKKIKEELAEIAKKRQVQGKNRKGMPIVAVVGYTNAGKSALINRLTGAELESKNQVFTSLDPRIRGLQLPNGTVVQVSDTVGFISDLPKILYTAFRSTLEEVTKADILLHVRDISHIETDYQRDNVKSILKSLKINSNILMDAIEVWNKVDKMSPDAISEKLENPPHEEVVPTVVLTSATRGDGIQNLLEALSTRADEILMTRTREEDKNYLKEEAVFLSEPERQRVLDLNENLIEEQRKRQPHVIQGRGRSTRKTNRVMTSSSTDSTNDNNENNNNNNKDNEDEIAS